jgi:predicted TIM-barrel fold metal-dependent hydrolase
VVDSHTHVWPFGFVHSAQRVQEPLHATPVDLLAAADDAGVDVVVMTPAGVYPDNGYILGAAGTAPTRLRAGVGMNPREPTAVEQLRTHAAAGAVGVRITPGSLPFETAEDIAALVSLAAAAADLGLVIQWTAGLALTGGIDRVAVERPDATQVLDHLGLPPDAANLADLARMRDLARIPRLHVKLSGMYALSRSGYPFRDTWPWAEGVLDAFGPDRTIWASDWPLAGEHATYRQLRDLVDELPFVDRAARTAMLSTTPARLWRVPDA